ncbi:YbhB/YbcL family Raf kinase inhibitor-like protein [Brevibacterium sp. 50QC2O2]|jgi:Raf kinase inhibitor-like YbhB/YbcL family protein|uniref:YbhB/YbcL family Raf kinase inhibitor-like protein n=1 Tax=Brevibacterium TaxID=1696 RepID=UPI00211B8DD0|nr:MULTISPECIES: YbhB/YbcL family Raf kinase inhibitor-like protein [unclassified Brevibacterium]MCQ9367804.1 YbhB/YbcL family Raf kinase inhibitor-like protein [Brevibacterium sp. 91QC2O2]MCQ9384890.1 YbhB/YbcL family Raf kinase inhibitor-like protein [Brevibacterium sp. 68QC2CO]MCQ9388063.1 YbhB/YbcL family Raf kinase inhibitor-like protein [Brevibacterium sp. 50QC2O2]
MSEQLNSPFARLNDVPRFTVTSTDVAEGAPLALAQASGSMGISGGRDESPQLSWTDFPEETKAFAVTCYDPDAPTGSGFWHWVVADIPGTVTELPTNAGNPAADLLPAGVSVFRNDAGEPRFVGAAPPAGHGPHRYFFIVHALSEPLNLPEDSSPAFVGFNIFFKSIGRAWLETTFEVEA